MSAEPYSQHTLKIADLFILKKGVAIDVRDVLAITGNTVNGRAEVDKMGGSYTSDKVIGVSDNKIASDYPYRAITVIVKGSALVKLLKNANVNQWLEGASDSIVETFSGNATLNQQFQLGIMPLSTITVVEATPTTLTEVPENPTTNQFSVNRELGLVTIGGTSVSGTNNYTVTYTSTKSGLQPLSAGKGCARALESKLAGELCRVYFEGVQP